MYSRFPMFPLLLVAALSSWSNEVPASDHADPISLNPFADLGPGGPRITDLHVFPGKADLPDSMIVILSVNGNMKPVNYQHIDLGGYDYRISMDLHAPLSFEKKADLERYGGTLTRPRDVQEEVSVQYRLMDDSCKSEKPMDACAKSGMTVNANRIVVENLKLVGFQKDCALAQGAEIKPSDINLQSGVFDDPFVFPRFFRRNVVSVAFAIPFSCFPGGQQNWAIWATTRKDGVQIDHVGRSQRTQLPRFDHLNTFDPRDHYDQVQRVHEMPTLLENILVTVISPLYGHRPYDSVPDVMIWNRSRPTMFPNGRNLEDDVGGVIAKTGDTQLFEVSYTEDVQYPRATKNDKWPFLDRFPYLRERWTPAELARAGDPFTHPGKPSFTNANQWKLRWIASALILVLGLALWLAFQIGRRSLHPAVETT